MSRRRVHCTKPEGAVSLSQSNNEPGASEKTVQGDVQVRTCKIEKSTAYAIILTSGWRHCDDTPTKRDCRNWG